MTDSWGSCCRGGASTTAVWRCGAGVRRGRRGRRGKCGKIRGPWRPRSPVLHSHTPPQHGECASCAVLAQCYVLGPRARAHQTRAAGPSQRPSVRLGELGLPAGRSMCGTVQPAGISFFLLVFYSPKHKEYTQCGWGCCLLLCCSTWHAGVPVSFYSSKVDLVVCVSSFPGRFIGHKLLALSPVVNLSTVWPSVYRLSAVRASGQRTRTMPRGHPLRAGVKGAK